MELFRAGDSFINIGLSPRVLTETEFTNRKSNRCFPAVIFVSSGANFDLPKAGNRVTIAGQGVVSWTAHL